LIRRIFKIWVNNMNKNQPVIRKTRVYDFSTKPIKEAGKGNYFWEEEFETDN